MARQLDFYEWTKTCYTCFEDKALTEFHKNRSRPDGLAGHCKPCAIRVSIASNRKRKLRALGAEEPTAVDQCAICGSYDNLCIDHCHSTGRFRGILCRTCNLGLGYFQDSAKLLVRAMEYLDGV